MRQKIWVSVVGTTLILSALINPAFASDTTLVPSAPRGNTFGIVVSDEDFFRGTSGSVLYTNNPYNLNLENSTEYQKLCLSLNENSCDPNKVNLSAKVVLGPCQGIYINPCIDAVEVIDNAGKPYALKYQRSTVAPEFIGNSDLNLPDGKTTSLWGSEDLPSVKNLSIQYVIDMGTKKPTDKEFTPLSVSLSISPYVARAQPLAKTIYFVETPPSDSQYKITRGALRAIGGKSYDANCAWQENGLCGVEQEFESGYRYQVTIAIPKALSGWLQGRLVEPEISISNINEKLNRMKVSAKAADVPQVVIDLDYSKKSSVFDQIFQGSKAYEINSGTRLGMSSDQLRSIKALDAFSDHLQNKANMKTTRWSFKSNAEGSLSTLNRCLYSDSKLMGLVTTNAMIYESGVPSFKDGFLEYRVAGLHLNPDDSIFQGSYDLLLRSEAARCLYGFSNAPVSAEISVLSLDGDKQIATTRVSEEKGWLHLGAYNFTFSSPTIQVKLEQQLVKAAAPMPSVSPNSEAKVNNQPVISSKRRVSITCIKGKATKKVTAINPKCPTGFKKK